MYLKENIKKIEGDTILFDDNNKSKLGNKFIKDSGDIYNIHDVYVKNNDTRLYFCFIDKEYKIDNFTPKIKGIVEIKKNGKLILDFYELKYNSNFFLQNKDKKKYNISRFVNPLNCKYFRKNIYTGNFYHIKGIFAIKHILKDDNFVRNLKSKYNYNLQKDTINSIKKLTKDLIISDDILKEYDFSNVSSIINNYSFGLEFETVAGFFNDEEINKLGIAQLRDGSIKGMEYATIPLYGEKGLLQLKMIVDFLKDKTIIDNSCSLHLHIGGIPRTESFILAFYKLILLIQNNYFEMFPVYKKYNLGIKRKNYSLPFPTEKLLLLLDNKITSSNLQKNFKVIYDFLTENESIYPGNIDLIKNHPKDIKGDHKWNISSRYLFINVIPLIFGNKETIEFRIHEESYNYNNIIYFILFNVGILEFVKNNEKTLLSDINKFLHNTLIYDIFYNVYDSYISNYMAKYIQRRKDIRNSFFKMGNIGSSVDKQLFLKNFLLKKKEKNEKLEPLFYTPNKKNIITYEF